MKLHRRCRDAKLALTPRISSVSSVSSVCGYQRVARPWGFALCAPVALALSAAKRRVPVSVVCATMGAAAAALYCHSLSGARTANARLLGVIREFELLCDAVLDASERTWSRSSPAMRLLGVVQGATMGLTPEAPHAPSQHHLAAALHGTEQQRGRVSPVRASAPILRMEAALYRRSGARTVLASRLAPDRGLGDRVSPLTSPVDFRPPSQDTTKTH